MSTLSQPTFSGPPQVPPKDFDPSKASDSDLEKYFFPPRPDPVKQPIEYATWESFAVKKPQYVEPAGTPVPFRNFGTFESSSGAYLKIDETDDDRWYRVQGSWTVPDVTPFNEDGTGSYEALGWIGIDGLDSDVAFKAGIQTRFTVDENGSTSSPRHTGVLLFHGKNETDLVLKPFERIFFSPGDLVTIHIWGSHGTRGPFYSSIWNVTGEQYTTDSINSVDDRLAGRQAVWGFGGRDKEAGVKFPGFKSFSFNRTVAVKDRTVEEVGLDKAVLFNAKDWPISTAKFNSGLVFTNVKTTTTDVGPGKG